MEMQWAEKICRCKTPEEGRYLCTVLLLYNEKLNVFVTAKEMLLAFPYHSNYIDLVRMELNALSSVKPNFAPRTFAMIGSGPLPLTPLCIADQLKSQGYGCITCHNVDLNPQAMEYSIDMCKALGDAAGTMCFHCADASSDDVDLRTFDVVYLAALVGGCSCHKQSILANMVRRMSPGTLVVLRSAHSLRRLLYPVRIYHFC